jgi:hypothetical protein
MSPIEAVPFSAPGRRGCPHVVERVKASGGDVELVSAVSVSRSASPDRSTTPPPRRCLGSTDFDANDCAVA